MRTFFCCALLFIASAVFAQNPNDPDGLQKVLADKEIVIENFKTRAYLNGARLDTVDAAYGTFFYSLGTLYFDYGQTPNKINTATLTDASGKKMYYKGGSVAAALNLMHYNGWEVVNLYMKEDTGPYFLMKKKQPMAAPSIQ